MTAWTEMAAARPPQPSDARVPCPLCGGFIHPVAGRCKHCKQDLSAFRSNRPAAAAQLPALNGSASNGRAVAAPAIAIPVPAPMREEARPILPPRPTARPGPVAEASAWRHWPIVVMALAVAAILVAVVVLLWPPSSTSHAGKLQPGAGAPGGDNMETQPLAPQVPPQAPPPPSNDDPWGGPTPQPSKPHAQITPRPTPDPLPQDPMDDTDSLDQMLAQNGMATSGSTATMMLIMQHLCDRVSQCGISASPIQLVCTGARTAHATVSPCDARTRCLDHIDELSCSTKIDDQSALLPLMTQFQDCIDAMTRC